MIEAYKENVVDNCFLFSSTINVSNLYLQFAGLFSFSSFCVCDLILFVPLEIVA